MDCWVYATGIPSYLHKDGELMAPTTRDILIVWGRSSTDAEYLSAGMLRLEGFRGIDPIHPQGGPDGTKDIKFTQDGLACVAGCYFPNDSNKIAFKEVKKKFSADLAGVAKNGATVFAFITNVSISDGERKTLEGIAAKAGCVACHVYHLERIRAILDAPHGYGLRLKYLDIEMTKEEQISFFDTESRRRHEQLVGLLDNGFAQLQKLIKEQAAEIPKQLHQLVRGPTIVPDAKEKT